MFASILSAEGNWFSQYGMFIIIAVVLVLMIVLTVIPQKKRQKQQQEMMDSLRVGTKIMTIGRMVGKIAEIRSDNTLVINVGTDDTPTFIVIDRNAVGLVLENVAAPAPAVEETPAAEEPAEEPDDKADAAPAEVIPVEDISASDDSDK